MMTRARWIVAGLATWAAAGCGGDPALSFGETMFDFGTLITDVAAPADVFCVTNTGDGDGEVATLVASAGFTIVEDGCSGRALGAGASCTVAVAAMGQAQGPTEGTLGDGALTLALDAWVLDGGSLLGSPVQLDFGREPDGATRAPAQGTVRNDDRDPVGPLSLAFDGQDAAEFELADNTCDGRTLAPGASCTFTVRMHPAAVAVGRKRASLVASAPGGGATAITLRAIIDHADGSPSTCPSS